MKKTPFAFPVLAVFLIFFSACNNTSREGGGQTNETTRINVAVAANMQFAMEDLAEAFEKKTGIGCELIVSSSGKLTAQIKQGAPFDVFVSANMMYPEEVQNSGLAAAPPKVYAYGKLILWTMKDGIEPSIEMLSDPSVRHIALANPKTAPYGVAALEVLDHYQLFDPLKKKIVYGESIAQTNQYVTTGSVELGFTALSVVRSPEWTGKGKWTAIESDLYSPIEQGVVVVKRDNGRVEAAKQFYDFLSSEEARQVLESYGYAVSGR
jgi:molybdate transport system substrate-binding protein